MLNLDVDETDRGNGVRNLASVLNELAFVDFSGIFQHDSDSEHSSDSDEDQDEDEEGGRFRKGASPDEMRRRILAAGQLALQQLTRSLDALNVGNEKEKLISKRARELISKAEEKVERRKTYTASVEAEIAQTDDLLRLYRGMLSTLNPELYETVKTYESGLDNARIEKDVARQEMTINMRKKDDEHEAMIRAEKEKLKEAEAVIAAQREESERERAAWAYHEHEMLAKMELSETKATESQIQQLRQDRELAAYRDADRSLKTSVEPLLDSDDEVATSLDLLGVATKWGGLAASAISETGPSNEEDWSLTNDRE